MAENKRTYTITINGLTESYENVKNLKEALDSLSDTVINVSKEESKTASERKSSAESTDALAKATQKLEEYDKAYQTELAKVNAELSANKKEISEAIKLQQAEATVNGEVGNSYREKQQYLSALNTLIRNNTLETEEQNQKQREWIQQSAELQSELKEIDSEMKIYVRNVGNYNEAADRVVEGHKSIKQELKELKTEMADMLANGVSKTDEGYLKLAERAGQLKDAMSDANQDIANFASDTRGLSNAINLAGSAVNAYQLYNSTMELFGQGNEDAAESMKKMMAVMTVLNSLQQVQNSLLENGSATARLYNKAIELVQAALGIKKAAVEEDIAVTEASTVAEEANTVANELNATASETNAASTGTATTAEATNTTTTTSNTVAKEANTVATNKMSLAQKAGAVASKTLSVALRAIPLMAIIGLVMALIQNWESIWNWFKKTFPVLDTLSKKFDKFGGFMKTVKAIAKGLGEGIINWLVTPFKTLAQVIGKVLEGDFVGAAKVAIDNVKGMFTGFGESIQKELTNAAAEAGEERVKKAKELEHKQTQDQLEELQARKGNQAKYSKEGIALQKKEFEQRKALAKGNAEELRKIKNEELSFERECQEQRTKAAEQGAKARSAAATKAANEAKKAYEEEQKKLDEMVKTLKSANDEANKLWSSGLKDIAKAYDELAKTGIADAEKEYNQRLKVNLEHERTEKTLKNQITSLRYLRDVQRDIYEKYPSKTLADDIEKTSESLRKAEREYLDFISKSTIRVNNQVYQWEQIYEMGLASSLQKTENLYAKRTEIAINSFAEEAEAEKMSYREKVRQLNEYILEAQKALKTADSKHAELLNEGIADAQMNLDLLKKQFEEKFGKYANFRIDIPVDLDLGKIQETYLELVDKFGNDLPITITELVQAKLGITDKISDDVRTIEEIWNDAINGGADKIGALFQTISTALNLSKDEAEQLYTFLDDREPFENIKDDLMEILTLGNVNLKEFGTLYIDAMKKVAELQKSMKSDLDKNYTDLISKQDKIISNNEKIIKNFQEAAKGLKLEPAMKDDVLSGILKGQIIDLDKTRERYNELESAYQEYLDSITEGSEQMKAREDAWQLKLEATKQKYGENSMEYKLMVDEKEKSDAAYAMEYEKVTQQIEDISQKQADLMYDYIESIANRTADITKTIQENVMNPIFDGLSDLFAFQLEEAKEALDEITDLYDKAVEAREQSADRMKEINEELRNDDGANKEALQQRLAEEEVLLVQREEAERALEKEKKKREYEVQVAEAKQRKFELGQKLAEGIVNTALGATAALKYGFPLGPVFAAIITAMGALQTAIIAKQIGNVKMPQKYADGGLIGTEGVNRSHKQGGHRIEGTSIEVEGGEFVVNKKSTDKYYKLIDAINSDNIGLVRKQVEIIREKRIVNDPSKVTMFASGGQINTLTATSAIRENNEIAAITELIKAIDFQPTVAVTDINRVNRRLVRVQDLAGKAV